MTISLTKQTEINDIRLETSAPAKEITSDFATLSHEAPPQRTTQHVHERFELLERTSSRSMHICNEWVTEEYFDASSLY